MKPLDYDLKIIEIVKNLRETNSMFQKQLANELNIDQSTYSRIEKGELAITHGQLKVIAELFETTPFKIMALANNGGGEINFSKGTFGGILLKLLLTFEGQEMSYSRLEMEFIVFKMSEIYFDKDK